MKIGLLLVLLSVSECSSSRVIGHTGQNVTLSCHYDITYHGPLHMCWGRGQVPASGCNDKLVSTDGHKVIEGTRASSRYQLLGRLDKGDVSLTILNVTESDSGTYGCRVELLGWFNDQRHNIDLYVDRAAQTTTSATSEGQTPTEQAATNQTAVLLTSTETLLTSSTSRIKTEENSDRQTFVVLVFVVYGLIALVTAGGLIAITKRRGQLSKIPPQVSRVVYSSSGSSTLQLHSRDLAVMEPSTSTAYEPTDQLMTDKRLTGAGQKHRD